MAGHGDPLAPDHLVGHVKDADYFEVPFTHIEIPQPFDGIVSSVVYTGNPTIDNFFEPLDLHLTKFMVLEVIAAVIVAAIFLRLAALMKSGERPTGRFWNAFEALLLFIRDEIARPAIGRHDATKFLPFLWTIFFFILGCNLLGMVPWAGSATGAFATTMVLAFITFCTVVFAGMSKMGPVGFWVGQVPHMDLPIALAVLLKPLIFVLEVIGLLIKHVVLSIRLLANMVAGHLVLAVLIAFVAAAADQGPVIWGSVSAASFVGAFALSLLELFVAFLQAYIFTFLSALFIGMAVHPH